jgi:hypothetical protein
MAGQEARMETVAPGYLEKVRAAARRLGVTKAGNDDAREAMRAVEELADIDLAVPTASTYPGGRQAKEAIRRLVGWYLSYFGKQVLAFGYAVSHLGAVLLERTEQLEVTTRRMESDLARLTARVAELESELGQRSAQ